MEANQTKTTGHETLRDAANTHLAGKRGKRYWRSLEELSETPEFQNFLDDEFPNRSTLNQIDRRSLLKFMGASLALAGISGCRGVFLPQDKVVPYVKQPEELVPGKPLFYATALTLAGYATGVLVEQHEGRPIKIEGNPTHPASLGAIDSITQAQVLSFYDPDRVGNVLNRMMFGLGVTADLSTWETFYAAAGEILRRQRPRRGAGIRIVTGAITSPTLLAQIQRFRRQFPEARWFAYEPMGNRNAMAGAQKVFGRALDTVYNFTRAEVVLSIDGDFLSTAEFPGSLRYAREFANGRRVKGTTANMNRLYVLESTPGLAGAMADHRWPIRGSQMYAACLAIAAALGIPGLPTAEGQPLPDEAVQAIAEDLLAHRGRSLVLTGHHQEPDLHALIHLINDALGNVGQTVSYIEPVNATVNAAESDLAELTEELNAGQVELLIMLEGNLAYDGPAGFAEAIAKAKTKVHIGMYDDETSHLCDWHLPLSHPLEAWGDARAFDGTLSVVQPLIAPIHTTKSAIEIFAMLTDSPNNGYDLVRETWRTSGAIRTDFEKVWQRVLHDGLLPNSAYPALLLKPTARPDALAAPTASAPGVEVNFRLDPSIYDGRFANNGWLQELPNPLTKLTWDNAAIVSPATAKALGVTGDDVLKITTVDNATIEVPAFVHPGQPADQVTLTLGYGRVAGGVVAVCVSSENDHTGRSLENPGQNGGTGGGGVNVYPLKPADSNFALGANLEKTGNRYPLATTQGHQPIEGDRIPQFEGDHREVVVEHDVREFREKAATIKKERDELYAERDKQNLYPEEIFEYNGPQWGMTIDLNTCIGCNACVTACQSENNIPVVGKEQVLRHREMHWLRIDRYFSGDDANPQLSWQPVMCVHCEKAPCEPVCPVAATVHSHEGLNQMIYNRCVGTRYCSNNCPYKVRRFNYLNYTDNQKQFDINIGDQNNSKRIPLLRMLNNPNVTVRGRGVMEKCTYCVQRINAARIEAKKQNREVKDGEVVTACQQACPTQTIVFGNIADRDSAVSQWRNDERAYLLLQELATRPRTSHLAKLRNPNPKLAALAPAHGGEH